MDKLMTITNNPKLLKSIHARVKREGWNKTQAQLCARVIDDHLGNIDVTSITTATMDDLKQRLFATGVSEGTIDRTMTSVSKLLKYASRRPEIYGNFQMPYIEYCNPDNARDRYLSDDEEREMIKWYDYKGWTDLKNYTLFLLDTGMRKGEGLRFRVRQVVTHTHQDTKETKMYVRLLGNTSTKKHQRVVPLTERAREIVTPLLAGKENEDVVFDLNYWTIGTRFDQVKAMMGLEDDKQFVLHTMRHTYASRLVQRGVPLYTVGQLMGHTNPRMTQRYAHFAPEQLLNAVDVLNSTTTAIDNVDNII